MYCMFFFVYKEEKMGIQIYIYIFYFWKRKVKSKVVLRLFLADEKVMEELGEWR